jgi:L-aspartate oxidase
MTDIDPRAELAPRDVVARAIVGEMTRTGADYVELDISHQPAERVRARFPQISATCARYGLDITRGPIPVAPAAHYTMGGVRTNLDGETTLPGLYACGEVACTGVHGANRLASNSLLETVVFAARVVARTLTAPDACAARTPRWRTLPPATPGEAVPPTLTELQALMWDRAGIVRNGDGLELARRTLAAWEAALTAPHDRAGHELANLIRTGRLVAEAASLREESRGAHYRSDFPQTSEAWRRHLVFSRDPS